MGAKWSRPIGDGTPVQWGVGRLAVRLGTSKCYSLAAPRPWCDIFSRYPPCTFLIIPVQLSSCSQFGACQRGAGWPALGLGVSSKKSPLGQSPAGAKYTRHFRTPPPYGHDGSLRFVTVFAHNGAVPVRSQVIHNFQEHPLLFGRRRAFRKGFPPTGPSSTDRRR